MIQNKYELDVDNYSEYELFQLIKYNGDINTITEDELNTHISTMIRKNNNKLEDMNTRNILSTFLNRVNDKLLSYIAIRPPVQMNPTNYDIIQSQNQLQGGQHDVTTDKIIPVVNVNNYKYPTGVINPLEKKTITKIISVDSEFREDYNSSSSSNFVWTLPDTEHKVVSIKIVSLELPVI